ncbi:helix-turn-helix transcriptional regulator [Nocardioides mangrovi]|uniref:AraC family transcriptional regulator n=1 Tax=Nocardioides mangrovi TaxID=2874580 RepID=A0ABS7U9L5_9ACTN|nr:AraC family transcriptional regulator [Nocardioides mangrovi]MBZ5737565.1 AraC family transcriptional regulator [Nocardioides mangrovi]
MPAPTIRAWRPPVAGVAEVLHAHFPEHAYPSHTHDTWTLLLVDTGTVRYDLERHEHGALGDRVTLLPPHVPHDGRSVEADGFRKRVVYLDADRIGVDRIGAAVDHPGWVEPALRRDVSALHDALRHPGDAFEAEVRLTTVADGLRQRLAGAASAVRRDRPLAHRLRDLLDERVVDGVTLDAAAAALGTSPTHLVRAFGAEFGIAPHRYLTGRRLDRARRMLLAGERAAEVAVAVGFHDQAHLTRHFRRLLGVAPAAYARSGTMSA